MQSSHEGGVPLEVSVKVSTPVQLDKPMTVACIANMELWDWCIFKMPCAKRAKTFTPATRYDGGRIRMSKRAIEDPKICEVHVDKVKSRDLGDWRCLVKSRSKKYKSTLFNVSETVPETTPKPTPKPTPGPTPEPGTTEPGTTGEPTPEPTHEPTRCPTEQPEMGSACSLSSRTECSYGEECCCGECHASMGMVCEGKSWTGFFTDVCLSPQCGNTTEKPWVPEKCEFSSDCPFHPDENNVCNHGECEGTGDIIGCHWEGCEPCTNYNECPCRSNPKKCFCVMGRCENRRWECHESIECKKMKKCKGKRCVCEDGTCEIEREI